MIHYSHDRWRDGNGLSIGPADVSSDASPGCLTTLRVHNGKPAFLQEHLERLCFESRALGMSVPDVKMVTRILAKGILKNRLKMGVSRIIWQGDSTSGNWASGLHVTFEGPRTLPRAATLLLVSFKPSGCRSIKSLAVKDAAPLWHLRGKHCCFDVLLQNEGDLLEATTGNLFLFRSGRLSTPRADGRILAGITRNRLLDAPALAAAERHHKRFWLNSADACFVTNCARGIIPVARIVTERGQIVWEGDPRHKVILQARRIWRRAMIESTLPSKSRSDPANALGTHPV